MRRLFVTIFAVLLLASCGNRPRLTKEEVIDYGEIGLSDIVSYIVVGYQSRWEDMDPDEMELSGVYRYCSPYCGFCQKDINGDGIPELLIGDKFEDGSTVLYDIYTIHPKTASLIHLASGGERDRFTVSESGTIIEEGSNSASDSFTKAYRIKKGKLVELKAVTLEECPMDIDITTFESLAAKASQPCGGYSEIREPDMDEYQFFREVTDTLKGMSFSPLTVQTQVVAGINYKFYCRYSDVTQENNPGHCYLTIYKPLPGRGDPTITSIEKINTTNHKAITSPMKEADLSVLGAENQFDLIGRQWMLITAGTSKSLNTMTASWGGFGWLWNNPVAFIFVRPERYTHDFIEKSEKVTLSFYPESCRKALQICGTKSGRDCDKISLAGLTPLEIEPGVMTFAEARLTVQGRKIFKADMKECDFIDKSILGHYGDADGGFHTVYVIEIEKVFTASL